MSPEPLNVLISAYRATGFVADCLDSVYGSLSGLRRRWRLLVGIDGCRDTMDAVTLYPFGSNASVYWFDRNVGMYTVSNTLAGLAGAGIAVQFGSDDLMLPEFSGFVEGADLDNAVVCAPYRDFYELSFPNPQRIKTKAACGVALIPSAVMAQLGGWRSWRCAADSDLLHRARMADVRVISSYACDAPPAFMRRRHVGELTSAAETSGSSRLRAQYHERTRTSQDIFVEPVLAECERVL